MSLNEHYVQGISAFIGMNVAVKVSVLLKQVIMPIRKKSQYENYQDNLDKLFARPSFSDELINENYHKLLEIYDPKRLASDEDKNLYKLKRKQLI